MSRHHDRVFVSIEALESRQLLAATTLRIDVGGKGYTGSGVTWAADRGASGGTVRATSFAVAGTSDDSLYTSRRYGNFSYHLSAASASYALKLYFVDPTFTKANIRKFDVFAEGKQIINDLDIAATVGGKKALIKTFNLTIADGALDLKFVNVKENAIVSAIELVPVASTPQTISWQTKAPAPLQRFEAVAASVNGNLYVFGGFYNDSIQTTRRADYFDLSANKWTQLPDVPEYLTHAGVAVDGNTIYLAGGFLGNWKGPNTPLTSHVWKFDTVAKKWSAGPALPAARAAGGLVRVGRVLHFFGGMNTSIGDASQHWTYDLDKKDGWKAAPAMPNPRNHFGYALIGTKIYVVGGQHKLEEETGVEKGVMAYDTATQKWSTLASLPIPRSHTHNATFARNGKIVTVGGATLYNQDLDDVLQYDPATNKWTTIAELPAARAAAVAQLVDGKIVVATGAINTIDPQTTVWVSNQ